MNLTYYYSIINVYVNVYVYSLISLWVQQTSQFTPLVSELSHIQSHLIGENLAFAHFAVATAKYYNLGFLFHQLPITAGWTEAVWYERLAQHLYTWLAAWLEHGSPVQVLTSAPCCLTSVIWWELGYHLAMYSYISITKLLPSISIPSLENY